MTTRNAKNVAAYTQRIKAAGGKRSGIDFTKQGVKDLEKIQKVRKLGSMSDAVNLALHEFAKIVVALE